VSVWFSGTTSTHYEPTLIRIINSTAAIPERHSKLYGIKMVISAVAGRATW
jgi:hypothetical protein